MGPLHRGQVSDRALRLKRDENGLEYLEVGGQWHSVMLYGLVAGEEK